MGDHDWRYLGTGCEVPERMNLADYGAGQGAQANCTRGRELAQVVLIRRSGAGQKALITASLTSITHAQSGRNPHRPLIFFGGGTAAGEEWQPRRTTGPAHGFTRRS